MKRLLAVLLVTVGLPAAAAPTLEETLAPLRAQLQESSILRGGFTQARTLGELPQPLRSSGDFVFARGQGIWWHTRAPFESEFVLTPKAMIIADAGGAEQRLDAARQPGLRLAAQVFLALFALDFEALQAHFEVTAVPRSAGWELELRPREAALAQVAAHVRLRGGAQIERVELVDARGDRTLIELASLAAGNGPLSTRETQKFGQ